VRIFTAIRHAVDPAQFHGGLWSANFYPALRGLGHEIVESQVDLAPASRFMGIASSFTAEERRLRSRITEQIVDEVGKAHRQGGVDVFLTYFYNSHFEPAAFADVRALGIPSINFFCNSIYQFALVADVARGVDWSWHAERDARDSYLEVGANPVWVQMAADPCVYRPVPVDARRPAACFVGQRYADRDRLAAALIKAGVAVDLYGAGWSASHPADRNGDSEVYLGRTSHNAGTRRAYVQLAETTLSHHGLVDGTRRLVRRMSHRRSSRMAAEVCATAARGMVPPGKIAETFSAYELCLNFSNVWSDGEPGSTLVPHVRLRDFEGPMSRSCYLTGHSDEIAEFYAIGREIDTYRDAGELVDKSRFYLANADAAERMRNAGFERATRDHTWTRRFETLFAKTGLTA
jgi:spore maturation protein CgeB